MAEPNKDQRASLKDVINYQPEKYITDDELALVRATFKDNPKLLKVIRKIMVPTVSDPELPIENMGSDFFLQGREWAQIPAEEAKILMVARQDALQFILGALIKLQVIANEGELSPIQLAEKRKKDSSK